MTPAHKADHILPNCLSIDVNGWFIEKTAIVLEIQREQQAAEMRLLNRVRGDAV
jgi:hypothetical protein